MNRILIFLLILATFKLSAQNGGIYYVATDGDDNNPGTFNQPWLTWQKAFDEADAGDTVYFRGGVYYSTDAQAINPSIGIGNTGTANSPIVYEGYPPDIAAGNWPILDCYMHCDSIEPPYAGADVYNSAIGISYVQYITFKCLEVRNVFQCDFVNSGAIQATWAANLTFERIRLHDVGCARGFYVRSGAWSYADSARAVSYGSTPAAASPPWDQPDTTRWINCDVWNVMDTLENPPGNAADPWINISYNGNYTYLEGCRAWNFGDDGFNVDGGKRVFNDCWVMSSNKYDGVPGSDLEQNGFKIGTTKYELFSFYTEEDSAKYINDSLVIMENCLAIFNGGNGFYFGVQSDSSCNERLKNSTAFANYYNISHPPANYLDTIGFKAYNNISYAATNEILGNPAEVSIYYAKYYETNNSWIWNNSGYPGWEYNPAFNLDSSDFVTTDSLELVNLFTAPRNPDGSLPDDKPLMLRSNSDLIDGGIDVGQPYYGQAPDLGYSEYRLTSNFDMQDTIPLSCIADITYTGGALASATYHWDFDGATVISGSGQGPYTVEWPGLGIKTVSLYVEESGNVSDTTTNDIYISELISSFALQDTAGLSNSVDITYTGNASPSATYHWNFDSATIINGSGQGPYTVEWLSIGDMAVSLYIEEPNYISDTTTNDIYIGELTSSFDSQDTACISNCIDIIYTGNASPTATYHWDFDSATVINGSGQGPYEVQWPSIGDKTVSLYVEDANFISDTSTNDICINALTSSFELEDFACIASTIDIIYTGNASDSAIYNWDFGSANIISGSGQGPFTVEWPIAGSHTVSLYVEESSFLSDTSANNIYINNNPSFSIIAYPDDTVTILDTITLMSISAQSYLWSTGHSTQNIDVFNVNGGGGGSQSYWLTLTDENGCSSTDSIVVWFEGPTSLYDFPNEIEIKTYPNPFSDNLNIEVRIIKEGQYKFEVIDSVGRPFIRELRHLKPGKNKIRLDPIYGYPGVYILFVKSDDGLLGVKKIIKGSN